MLYYYMFWGLFLKQILHHGQISYSGSLTKYKYVQYKIVSVICVNDHKNFNSFRRKNL